MKKKYAVTGIGVIWGCGCGLHPGEVESSGLYSEDPVKRRNVGDL